ncbi:MAG: hypothetical protein CMH13_01530 [Martelella sp.]|uniref:hypothetical protein n=1 Tax=unclassified Martelella TaxID=2629616 RepID=UPI000C5D5FF6|nr:hypothetical protein [Martelella sp.]MAU19197.1 hypothetical protein [Martelella sp.]|tara:strand:- start:191 stop:475 length:285 start_codon:yes stop_codon:yes gene_type:complete
MNELARIIPIPLPFSHGYEAHTDMRARLAVEGGRDWRGPEQMRARMPGHAIAREGRKPQPPRACKLTEVCGFSMCHVCGGNDIYDAPFTCGAAS